MAIPLCYAAAQDVVDVLIAIVKVQRDFGNREDHKQARMKYLIQKIGFDAFMELITQERTAIKTKSYEFDRNSVPAAEPAPEHPGQVNRVHVFVAGDGSDPRLFTVVEPLSHANDPRTTRGWCSCA